MLSSVSSLVSDPSDPNATSPTASTKDGFFFIFVLLYVIASILESSGRKTFRGKHARSLG